MCVCAHVCVCACVRVCVLVCVCACADLLSCGGDPQVTSTAGQQLPEEALAAWDGSKGQGNDELTRPERKRKRAQRKAAGKKQRAQEVSPAWSVKLL